MKMDIDKLKDKLTQEQYDVCVLGATEAPFTGDLLHNKKSGVYVCTVCGQKLFSSHTKYDSGSGWPSFYEAMDDKKIELKEDNSLGMHRTEVVCGNCGSHLGYVFDDGPRDKTGKRFCINSVTLKFEEDNKDKP